jgi:hypothetical protein
MNSNNNYITEKDLLPYTHCEKTSPVLVMSILDVIKLLESKGLYKRTRTVRKYKWLLRVHHVDSDQVTYHESIDYMTDGDAYVFCGYKMSDKYIDVEEVIE